MAATLPPRTFKHGEYVNAVPLRPGGMATVFSATHVPSGDRVAIKRHDRGDPARFQREGRLICDPTLRSHRFSNHVVMGREVFSEGGADYLVMELVDGLPLSERPFHHLPLRKALLLVDSILNGIEYLHDSGCIHRDIKPQNLLYLPHASTPYFVKIVDLGIARYADGLVTATQFGMGTLTFTAPECFLYPYDSKETADLYSVGATLFFLVVGASPFFDLFPDPVDCPRDFSRLVSPPIPHVIPHLSEFRPEVPSSIENLVLDSLSKTPSDRPQSVSTFRSRYHSTLDDLQHLSQRKKLVESLKQTLTLQVRDIKRGERTFSPNDNADTLSAVCRQLCRNVHSVLGSNSRFLDGWTEIRISEAYDGIRLLFERSMATLQQLSNTSNDSVSSAELESRLNEAETVLRQFLVIENRMLPLLNAFG